MTPRLASIAGPFEGTTYSLTEDEFSIGRIASSQLRLTEPEVSRRHCVIRWESGGFKEQKKQLIMRALDQSGGSYAEAARLLGMHVNYLHRLIKNLDLRQAIRGE